MTPAWDESLTEHDVKVLEARPPKPRGTPFGQRPALLVIDMNRGALGDDRPAYEQQAQYPGACGESGWAALRRMQPLIAAARSASVPVVYSRNIARASQGLPRADDPTWMYSELSPLSELTPEIPMAPGDLLVEKQRASVFFPDEPYLPPPPPRDRHAAPHREQHRRVRPGVGDRRRGLRVQDVRHRRVRLRPFRVVPPSGAIRPTVQVL